MDAVYALAAAATKVSTVHPGSVAAGMQVTFAVAAVLIGGALAISVVSRRRLL